MSVCLNCGCTTNNNKFCSRHCAVSYNNKLRKHISNETKQKTSNSLKSYYDQKGRKQHICKVCGKKYFYVKGINTKAFCSNECRFYYKTHRNEFLTEEALKRISEGGRKSAISQGDSKRSRNEIYFYELCKQKFNKVLNNECIFNGWDADIIIEDYKIAILWNGPWHYKKIKEKHSVKQVQNRDKIKISEIQKIGYIPYIIKDMGKYNKSFVEIEFQKFLEYININMAG